MTVKKKLEDEIDVTQHLQNDTMVLEIRNELELLNSCTTGVIKDHLVAHNVADLQS